MIKKITAVFFTAIIFTVAFLSTPVFAAEKQEKAVYDLAGLLSENEISEIEAAANEFHKNTKCNIYIVTENKTPYNSYNSVNYWGENFINEYLNGKAGNSVILIISNNRTHNYNMYTYGKCNRRISDSEVNEILDAPLVFDNLKNAKNYSSAITEFISMSAVACKARIGLAIVIALLFSVPITAICAACIIYSYRKKLRSEKYPLNRFANLTLTESNDIFMGTFVTKRIISQNNGSSRGNFGGGRSGGGGGAGHRGGR